MRNGQIEPIETIHKYRVRRTQEQEAMKKTYEEMPSIQFQLNEIKRHTIHNDDV